MTARDYIGCFIAFLIIPMLVIGVVTMPAAAQPVKPVWDYHCYITFNGAVDALNGLPAEAAKLAKFVAVNSDRAYGQPYCIVAPK